MKFYLFLAVHESLWVAPLAGAWIEIVIDADYIEVQELSLPSRGRGLKFLKP